ncbi:Mini-ribonuclease 3 [Lacticaseibacillus saniviri]|uniref:Mini-ribonuclease 3 n=1 Tax=Lacticaseibacillus saniviri JCM 17471 = DSM 24301 TaxID=1293598 RepID=A0A0R2MX07_9LACO|nr:Mini-ribonuclease 3 [Lacticaseibacillus saniviri]KRO18049.1 ribonuclease III family protein [Lacticaseibacillus saniviri JCM 17471 = DSM 24301]MCG4282756.1 Mini-ribonuclease 3 [Lacticaseibacillus saniviri]
MISPNQLNGIALAYLGDAVYEVFIRQNLLNRGIVRPNQLQKAATAYVSAKAQAALIKGMQEAELLTQDEIDVFQRGRNAKSYTHAKNTDVVTYRFSTGFEALFGYLQLTQQTERIAQLAQWCIDYVEEGGTGHGQTRPQQSSSTQK